MSRTSSRPGGFLAIGLFLLFGAVTATVAGVSLLVPGTWLDPMWQLNPTAHAQLAPMGRTIGILFPLLGVALACAGIGWLKGRFWGWLLAVLLIGMNLLGDLINFALGDWLKGSVGVAIAGALLFYMTRARVRGYFRPGRS
jgi:hypothetical protein